ncbi:glutamate ABC transporter substrate-binding protein [Prauserella muralis]|uniref:ABC transporter substrate-binding protein n=1 Tax=Prauserella muralis TaxID=588067 RepID=A0A2V4AJF6_9PSEU|nr:glutamate ABC transporter substrate-binding protein [Prauserella muralis]PXY19761.1 ABC transporter substrate-binding protein [Prauserella muralis]TWE29588.1 amino acid ABC transporter substrate-binding protein (PAAT family) [Prauserella muralis]
MRLSKVLRAGAVVAAASLALAACGGGSDDGSGGSEPSVNQEAQFEDGTTMAKLNQAGSVTIGTKFDQPLFGLKTLNGELEGFDVEIGKIIAGELGISPDKINWVETPSATREEVIEQGKVDFVVATYTINDERKQRVSFAGPYYQAGQDLMVKEGNNEITGPESLKQANAKVCSVTGSTPSEEILKYIDKDQLVLFDVYSKCADALRNDQVDAVTTDNVILLGLVEESNGEFKLVDKPFTEEPYGIGIKKGDTKFCEFIHDTLRKAAESGAYAEAWKNTAGQVSENTPELPELDSCA